MPIQERHDLREYHIFTEPVSIAAAATAIWVPVPEAGYLVRVRALETIAVTVGNAVITFENDTVACSGSLTIPVAGAAVNRTTVADLTGNSPLNFFYEAETGDLVAKSGLIEVVSAGTGGAGTVRFVFTIRP